MMRLLKTILVDITHANLIVSTNINLLSGKSSDLDQFQPYQFDQLCENPGK